MIKSRTIIEKVNEKYQDLKTKRYSIARYNENVIKSNPELIKLENELGEAKFKLAKASYVNNETEVVKLKYQIQALNEVILNLKSKLNLLKTNYNCTICNDSGYVDEKRCKCFYKYLTETVLDILQVENTAGVDFNVVSPNPKLLKQFKAIKNYAENFPNTQINNLVLTGNVGTGKTTLAKCVLESVKNKGNIAIFLTSADLNNIFLKMHTAQVDRNLTFEVLCDADLLIIDDLGTENVYKNVTLEYLLSLVSCRIERNKHLIITTNLSNKELYERYNERFFSRLSDSKKTLFVPFFCEDMRKF